MSTFDSTTLEARQFPVVGNEQAHVVQFYTKDSFLLDGLCEFVRCALEDGESVILVVSQAHRDGLRQRIKAAGIGTRIASRAGRYVLLDAAETMAKFMTGNMPDRRKFESVMGMVIRRAEAAALVKYRRVAAKWWRCFGRRKSLMRRLGWNSSGMSWRKRIFFIFVALIR
jgi:hypothetical protein